MKRPFDTVLEQSYNALEKSKINSQFNFIQTDKILVWIVGFSVTAFSLIISGITNLGKIYGEGIVYSILVLLATSIVSGIIYRFSALLYLRKYQTILFFLEGGFSTDKMMPEETKELNNPDDIKEIYRIIKGDFGQDYDEVLNQYLDSTSNEEKYYLINYLKNEYSRLAEWAKSEYRYAEKYRNEIYRKAFGMSEQRLKKIIEFDNHSFYLKIFYQISLISLIICVLTFIAILLILVMNFPIC